MPFPPEPWGDFIPWLIGPPDQPTIPGWIDHVREIPGQWPGSDEQLSAWTRLLAQGLQYPGRTMGWVEEMKAGVAIVLEPTMVTEETIIAGARATIAAWGAMRHTSQLLYGRIGLMRARRARAAPG